MPAEENDSQCAYYKYATFNCNRYKEEPRHPKMPSLWYLIAWQILGAFVSYGVIYWLFDLMVPNAKWGENSSLGPASTSLSMIFFFVDGILLGFWRFPRGDMPRMGIPLKIVLEMAMVAAVISCTILKKQVGPTNNKDHDAVLLTTLITTTAFVYVHIKHWFVFDDLKFRDLLLVALLQIVIYYTLPLPCFRVVAIVSAVLLVAYRLWAWYYDWADDKKKDTIPVDPEAQLED